MTITASCPMNFRYFPMDHQICDFEIESCNHLYFLKYYLLKNYNDFNLKRRFQNG